jgi:lactate dehydrogenase-like 2-hydroxyacid dehydrogenase
MTTTTANTLAELKLKMETREARIGIVGMGYVGLPLAMLFSDERFRACCQPQSSKLRKPDFTLRRITLRSPKWML